MGKRLNKKIAIAKAWDDERRKFYEARYDKYGARDPLLRHGQPGFEMSEQQWKDLQGYGMYGQTIYNQYRENKRRYQQEMQEWQDSGGVDERGKPLKEPTNPITAGVRSRLGGMVSYSQGYRDYVYGSESPKNYEANKIGVFMDKKLAEYEEEERAEEEYRSWKQKTDAELAKKAARAEYKRRGREVFGRASTYMGAEAGLVDDPETRKKRMRGKMIMGE